MLKAPLQAPSKTMQLLDGAPWTFKVDHGALYELCNRSMVHTDPIKLLLQFAAQSFPWDTIWELAWAAAWSDRQDRSVSSFIEFVSQLPVGEDWYPFRVSLVEMFCKALDVDVDEEHLPANPSKPQPNGTGATESIQPPSSLDALPSSTG